MAPGEEPRFFDDIGCLRDFVLRSAILPAGAVAFVADHRTGAWARASAAVYSRCPALETPMASHLVAHGSAESLAADSSASACAPVAATGIFGPAGPPDGQKASPGKP